MKITKSKDKLNLPVDFSSEEKSLYTMKKMLRFVQRNGHGWLGLASNQVGLGGRVIVAKLGGKWVGFINPQLTDLSKSKNLSLESCLSVPNKEVVVERHFCVTITSWNQDSMKLTGQDAFVVQHEIDHLDGVLMTDRKLKDNLFANDMVERSQNEHSN